MGSCGAPYGSVGQGNDAFPATREPTIRRGFPSWRSVLFGAHGLPPRCLLWCCKDAFPATREPDYYAWQSVVGRVGRRMATSRLVRRPMPTLGNAWQSRIRSDNRTKDVPIPSAPTSGLVGQGGARCGRVGRGVVRRGRKSPRHGEPRNMPRRGPVVFGIAAQGDATHGRWLSIRPPPEGTE